MLNVGELVLRAFQVGVKLRELERFSELLQGISIHSISRGKLHQGAALQEERELRRVRRRVERCCPSADSELVATGLSAFHHHSHLGESREASHTFGAAGAGDDGDPDRLLAIRVFAFDIRESHHLLNLGISTFEFVNVSWKEF